MDVATGGMIMIGSDRNVPFYPMESLVIIINTVTNALADVIVALGWFI